jgi:hypothetical protein
MSDDDYAKSSEEWRTFIDRTIGDTLVKVETDTAKLNLLRLFYRDETRPVIPFELYNSAENPQIRLNVRQDRRMLGAVRPNSKYFVAIRPTAARHTSWDFGAIRPTRYYRHTLVETSKPPQSPGPIRSKISLL